MPSVEALKERLWTRWGTPEHPAEWDGKLYGGGHGSQRFWEYLWTLDQLTGSEKWILDVGAGPKLFLPNLLETEYPRVWAADPTLREDGERRQRKDLTKWVLTNPSAHKEVDCITCVSVVEHIRDPRPFFQELDRFSAATIIVTLELGEEPPRFEHQFTLKKLYECLQEVKGHYLSRMETCPVWADNSQHGYWRPFGFTLRPRSQVR